MFRNMIRSRFTREMKEEVANFTNSLSFDKNIFKYEILSSIAHVLMLYKRKIIDKNSAKKIIEGLKEIYREGFILKEGYEKLEDIHIVIEKRLEEKIGKTFGKMHIGRSRNDLIANDLRMLAREKILELKLAILKVIRTLLKIAQNNLDTVMPGYTHMQHAQPVTLAHHMLAHADALLRDVERLEDAFSRVNRSVLGACALAGTSFEIDREEVAKLLVFEGLIENTIDAVASRDFILETVSCTSIALNNASRLVEELILWSTYEFSFIELSDEVSSTSSIMPQKKNPDVLEIARARICTCIGDLATLMAIINAKPLAYNRDFQEANPIMLRCLNTAIDIFKILNIVLNNIKINKDRLESLCKENYINATDLAEHLVKKFNLTFREAHNVVGRIVLKAIERNIRQEEITSELVREVSREVLGKEITINDKELKEILSPKKSIESKNVIGSPKPSIVEEIIKRRKKIIEDKTRKYNEIINKLRRIEEKLINIEIK